jgi:hypothetical protein
VSADSGSTPLRYFATPAQNSQNWNNCEVNHD